MNHSNTFAGFLGISPVDYSSSFDSDELDICGSKEEQETTTINPSSGLPLISNSLIDVGGNIFGTCDNNDPTFMDTSSAIIDDHDSMNPPNDTDSMTDISFMNDDTCCNASSLDDSSTFPDDTFDSAIDDSWTDW